MTNAFDPKNAKPVGTGDLGGFNPSRAQEVNDPTTRSATDYLRDATAWGLKSAIAVPEAAVGLADMVTGGKAGKALENEGGSIGLRFKEAKQVANDIHSDATKLAQQKLANADGLWEKAKTAVQNPSTVVGGVAESLAPMVAGGVIGRGAMLLGNLGRMGSLGAAIAGAAGEGVVGAGSAAEQIRQQTADGELTAKQAALAAGTGLATGALGFAGNKVANRLGIGDADMMLAQGTKGMAKDAAERATAAAVNPLAQPAHKSILRQMGEGAITEGVLEELPQSVSEQILQNEALGKSWSEGLDDAIVMGILSGGAMGAGAAGYRGFKDKQIDDAAANARNAAANAPGAAPGQDQAASALQPAAWTTSAGAAADVEPGTAPASPANAPNLDYETQPGAAPEAQGNEIDFTRDFPAPEWGTELGAAGQQPAATAAPELTPSQAMGLDPNAGALSKTAAMAVDSGAFPVLQPQVAPVAEQLQAAPQVPAGVDPDTGEVSLQAQMDELKSRIAFMNQQGATQGWDGNRAAQRNALQTQLTRLELQAAGAQGRGASTAGAPAPVQLTGINQILAKQIPDMSEQELLQAIAHYSPNHKRTKKLEKALQALAQKPLTAFESGANGNVSQADQTQQGSAQPAQAGAAQAGQDAGQGLGNGANPTANPGAQEQGASLAKAQAQVSEAAVGKAAQIAREGNAEREAQRQRQLDASERWTRMTTVERQAVTATAPGLNPIARKNLHTRAWPDIGEKIREKLLDSLVEPLVAPASKAPEAAESVANAAPAAVSAEAPAKPAAQPVGDEKQFAAETGTLGVPRAEMPQIPTANHGGLVKHLNAQGIAHETTTVDAAQLKPTQAEYSPSKVEAAKSATGDRAVIVSRDGHIIDGHHQAVAAAEEGKQVKAIVLDAPVEQALAAVKASPSANAAAPAPVSSPHEGEEAVFSTASAKPAKSMSVQEVQAIADRILEDLGVGAKVRLQTFGKASESGLRVPPAVVPMGATSNGKVYLFAESLGDPLEVFRVVVHEVFHLGLSKSVQQGAYIQKMLGFLTDPTVRKYAERWKGTADGLSRRGSMPVNNWQALAVEEALSDLAEELVAERDGIGSKPMADWARRMASRLARWSDGLGLKGVGQRIRAMTQTEVEQFIVQTLARADSDAPALLRGGRFSSATADQQGANGSAKLEPETPPIASFRRQKAEQLAGADFDVESFLQGMNEGQPTAAAAAQAPTMNVRPSYSPAARAEAVRAVKGTADAIRQAWANGPEVIVAFDMQDPVVPESARRADLKQRSGGARGAPEGFYYQGKVYLMASKLKTPNDAARVLFHEALGHHGLRGLFGKDLGLILNQVATMRKADVDAKIAEYGLRRVNRLDRRTAAEEVLAEMAQNTPQIGFVRRAIAAIRTWLRTNVPGFKSLALTDAELIRNFILPARGWVENGGSGVDASGVASFSRGSRAEPQTDMEKALLLQGAPVAVLDLKNAPSGGYAAIEQWAAELFAQQGGKAISPEFGEVVLDARSAKSSIAHGGANDAKKVAFAAVKDVIERGALVYRTTAGNTDSFYTSAPVSISGKDNIVTVLVRRDHNTQRMYLHSVSLKENLLKPRVSSVDAKKASERSGSTTSGDAPTLTNGVQQGKAATEDVARELNRLLKLDTNNVQGANSTPKNEKVPNGKAAGRATAEPTHQTASLTRDKMEGRGGILDESGGDGNVMFSRSKVTDAVGSAIQGVTITNIKQQASFKATDYMGLALQALGRRQLTEVYSSMLPQLQRYSDLMAQMDADKNEAGAGADELATDWGKLKDERELAELMHDATLEQMDPAKPYVEGDKKADYQALRQRYEALTPEAQAIYARARDSYSDHMRDVRTAIKERINRSGMTGERKQNMLKAMEDDFFGRVKGVYFPLARFGQYVVVVKNESGKAVNVSRAETMAEASELQGRLRDAYADQHGITVGKVLKAKEFVADRDTVGSGFMQQLYGLLDKQGMEVKQRAELEDALGQLYLSSMPDMSWAKHGIHRKGMAGFSQDARRAFAQNTFHGARYLAKLRYSDLLQDELTDMDKHISEHDGDANYNSVRARQVLDEMVKRHDAAMNPDGNPLSTALTSLGFIFHLGLSPASAMVNLTQTALVAYPVMGAKWGYAKASAALLRASKESVRGKNDITAALNANERSAYDEAVRAGVIDVTMAHDLAGIAQGEDRGVMWKLRPVMKGASWLFHHAEKFNRQATFVAAYRLARDAGAGHQQAYTDAVKATYAGHFDYSSNNRPRIMQGNVARVLLLFKQFSQNMIYTLVRSAQQSLKAETPAARREARKMLAGLLTMHAMAAGTLGLPLVGTLLSAASMLGGSDDEPWDAQVALQNLLADTFGQKTAEVLAHGLSRLTPGDISGRVGLNQLIFPDIQEGLEGQRLAESAMTAALGPVAGIGVNVLKGLQGISEGQYLRGLESMLPSFLRAPVKTIRYWAEGVKDKSGVVIKDEVDFPGLVSQSLGFSPSEVRMAYEGKSAIVQHDKALQARRSTLVEQYAMAAMAKDEEGRAEARVAIEQFNEKNPNRRILPLQLIQSVRIREKRIREAQNGVYLPVKRRDALGAGRFSFGD